MDNINCIEEPWEAHDVANAEDDRAMANQIKVLADDRGEDLA